MSSGKSRPDPNRGNYCVSGKNKNRKLLRSTLETVERGSARSWKEGLEDVGTQTVKTGSKQMLRGASPSCWSSNSQVPFCANNLYYSIASYVCCKGLMAFLFLFKVRKWSIWRFWILAQGQDNTRFWIQSLSFLPQYPKDKCNRCGHGNESGIRLRDSTPEVSTLFLVESSGSNDLFRPCDLSHNYSVRLL